MTTNVIEMVMTKTGKQKEELHKELDEIFSSLDKSLPENVRKKFAINRFTATYRKILSSNAQIFEGVFIGGTGAFDLVAKRRREALELFKTNPEKAIKQGITDNNGVPLRWASEKDQKRMQKWQKDQLGKPLPEEDIQRTLIGVVKIEKESGSSKYIQMRFKARGRNTEVNPPTGIPVKYNGLMTKKSTEDLAYINDAGELKFTVIGETLKSEQMETLIKGAFKNQIINLSQFDTYCQQHQEWERMVAVKATVVEIVPRPMASGNQIIRIQDETMNFLDSEGNVIPAITCWVPEWIPINFPEGSEVWVIGQNNMSDKGKSISVYGIYVPDAFKNMVPTPKKISEGEPSGGEEW